MKIIKIVKKTGVILECLVDDADYDDLMKYRWHEGKGCVKRHERSENHKTIRMHRQLLGLTDRRVFTDHKDGNPLNNQRSNLRPCTNSENCKNRRPNSNGTSKYLGVSWKVQKNIYKSKLKNKSTRWRSAYKLRIWKRKNVIVLLLLKKEALSPK